MKKCLAGIFILLISGFVFAQDGDISKLNNAVCDCAAKNVSDTLSIVTTVANCIANEGAKLIIEDKNIAIKYELNDSEKLEDFLLDREIDAFTECEFIIVEADKERKMLKAYLYDGSENPKAQELYESGNKLMNAGDYEEAIVAFESALDLDETFVEASDHIGLCYRFQSDYKKAEQWYKNSQQICPNGDFAYQNLAVAYLYTGDLQKALGEYESLLGLDLSNPEPYYGIALVLMEANDLEQANLFIDIAISIYEALQHESLGDAYLIKALLERNLSGKKAGKKWLKKAKKQGKDLPEGMKF